MKRCPECGRRYNDDSMSFCLDEGAEVLGANVQYTEFPGVGHDAWNPAYERDDLFEWMLKQRRR